MTLNESVAKLQTLLPVLKASDAKFAADLIASYRKYKGLTPKQEPWIFKLIARAEIASEPKPVFSAPLAPAAAVNVGGFEGVVALFGKAKESGLKFPKITILVNGTKVILSLNGPKSKAPGAVSLSGEGKYPNRKYFGRVTTDGAFVPAAACYGEFMNALAGALVEFAKAPAEAAKASGKLTGNCCFCNKALGLGKEKRSVVVGFGPDCAENYGLKAEWLAAADKAEVLEAKEAGVVPAFTVVATYEPTPVEEVAELQVVETPQGPALSYGPNPGDVGDLEPVTTDGPVTAALKEMAEYDAPTPKVCLFCGKPSADAKVLNGFAVCGACASQLA